MIKHKMQFEDQKYFKATLQVVSALCILSTGILGMQGVRTDGNVLTVIGLFVGMLFSGAMFILTWQNNLTVPRYLTPPVAYSIVVFLSMVGDGIRDEAIFGFILVITLAGLLIGRYWVVFYTFAGVLAISIIGLGQYIGWFPRIAYLAIIPQNVFIIDIIFILIGAVTYVIIANLERVLSQVREREIELEVSNQALIDIQAGLEERIAERVHNLNTAREEAEAARAEIEKQAWQTTGLARLGELLRGEQDCAELASKVIRYLCSYLDAQVGAIFLLDEGDQLQRVGAFACHEKQPSSFSIGESIVGQAVQSKETILLTGIPENVVRISSGLAETPPRHLIEIPIIFNGDVTGVVEIGMLQPFGKSKRQFLETMSDSLAIAFHTAQTRTQMDQLLSQTYEQAAELRERGEELRAINEELEAQAENLRAANQELQEQARRLRSYEDQSED